MKKFRIKNRKKFISIVAILMAILMFLGVFLPSISMVLSMSKG